MSPRRRAGRHPGRWGTSQRLLGRGPWGQAADRQHGVERPGETVVASAVNAAVVGPGGRARAAVCALPPGRLRQPRDLLPPLGHPGCRRTTGRGSGLFQARCREDGEHRVGIRLSASGPSTHRTSWRSWPPTADHGALPASPLGSSRAAVSKGVAYGRVAPVRPLQSPRCPADPLAMVASRAAHPAAASAAAPGPHPANRTRSRADTPGASRAAPIRCDELRATSCP